MQQILDHPGVSKAYLETDLPYDGGANQTLVVETWMPTSILEPGWNEEAFGSLFSAIQSAMKRMSIASARIKRT